MMGIMPQLVFAALTAIGVAKLAAATAAEAEIETTSFSLSFTQERMKMSLIDTSLMRGSADGLELLQRDAVAIDGKAAAKKEDGRRSSSQAGENNIAEVAQQAADDSLQAAQRAAVATAQVMSRNKELEIENENLREGMMRKSSIGSLVGHVMLRSVPPHRLDKYNVIARNVEYTSFSEEVLTFPKRRPWATNVVIATTKTFLADLVVQATNSKDDKTGPRIDWRRSMLFLAFGLLYVGILQWFFYVTVFCRMLPSATSFANKPIALKLLDKVGQEDLLIQVVVDQFIIAPLVYFPIFYVLKEVLNRRHSDDDGDSKTQKQPLVMRAMSKYAKNFWQDNTASMAVWFPSDFLIFMAPMWLRMPLDHAVAFIWTMIMSYMRGGAK